MKKQVLNFALGLGLLFPSLISSQEKEFSPATPMRLWKSILLKTQKRK